MLVNIVDNREHRFRWKCINAILEPASHDNSCKDSDRAASAPDATPYEDREGISLAEAIAWANTKPHEVTLFLYDEGCGTTVR